MAGEFPCRDVDLLSHLPLSEIGGGEIGNDMWGWTDPATGREYALVGKTNGTAFVDITKADEPVYLGQLPTQSTTGGIFWRDIKVYKNHAFVVSENTNHGMQVFDLTRLRNVDGRAGHVHTPTPSTAAVSNTHNLDINEDRLRVSRRHQHVHQRKRARRPAHGRHPQPANPYVRRLRARAARTPNNNYVHDTQCVIYAGPDTPVRGARDLLRLQRERRRDLRRDEQGRTRS